MTETVPAAAPRASATTFPTHSPATGERLAEYPVHGPEDVARAVARARTVQAGWAALPASRRRTARGRLPVAAGAVRRPAAGPDSAGRRRGPGPRPPSRCSSTG
ncbi:aldehyde dehydrogenase family protein [Streptomyces sp. NPDC093992]|uniref:aldehyde dehydrogenase family protein n=1 Tax=Streptomyces sp. NPDC093992 TaxID=3366053 RepID=UPI003838AB50